MKWLTLALAGTLVALLMVGVGTAAAAPDAALMGTYWRAAEISGAPVAPQPQEQEAHLVLTAEGKQASGSTGCNRFTGTFTQSGDSFRFSQIVSTKMACPPPLMAQEQAFLAALKATTAAHVAVNTLELKDASGKVRMRLQARPR
jgi:heat shock protein HslJ